MVDLGLCDAAQHIAVALYQTMASPTMKPSITRDHAPRRYGHPHRGCWNQPGIGSFFSGAPCRCTSMRTPRDTDQQIDAQADVLLEELSVYYSNWLAQVFTAAQRLHAFDIADVRQRDRLDLFAGCAAWRSYWPATASAGRCRSSAPGTVDPAFQDATRAYAVAAVGRRRSSARRSRPVRRRRRQYSSPAPTISVGSCAFPTASSAATCSTRRPTRGRSKLTLRDSSALADCCPISNALQGAISLPLRRRGRWHPSEFGSVRRSVVCTAVLTPDGPRPLSAVTLAQAPVRVPESRCSSDGCSVRSSTDHPCAVALRFAPVGGGAVTTTLLVPSDAGTLSVPVTAVAPSVSSRARPTAAASGDHDDRWRRRHRPHPTAGLALSNPLSTPVRLTDAALSGANAREFAIRPNDCARVQLAPGGRCLVYVLFEPRRAGVAGATLTLHGDGNPLQVALRATAFALPVGHGPARDRVEPVLRGRLEQPDADRHRPGRDRSVAAVGTAACRPWALPRFGRRGRRVGAHLR